MSTGKDPNPPPSSAPIALSTEAEPPPRETFPVVGVGASAGGLGAFTRLLAEMPADGGLAFILVPHLDPKHSSLMAELLAKKTRLPIKEAEEGERVQVNHAYVIPPNRTLTVQDGHLRLHPASEAPTRETAIDPFLHSLAADMEERAVGIVLSGTGSHGASGLKEIKLRGGLVLAQEPQSADFPQMPESAIATGVVDFVRPPERMAEELLKFARFSGRSATDSQGIQPDEAQNQNALNQILERLRSHSQLDFRLYRRAMLLRRIQRRMMLNSVPTLTAYIRYLDQQPEELQALYKDLLINVSAFFRDPEAFETLAREVLPGLVKEADDDHPVRIWVPACATGEEAWTLAMLVVEAFNTINKPPCLQLFATDIDDQALHVARKGVYPPSIALEVSPERLARFFTQQSNGSYRVTQELRDLVLFAVQNVIGDPPFSRLDLISCRNFLIYLEQDVQQKTIALFHFGLKAKGYLLLGPSETIRGNGNLFTPLSRQNRLFQKQGTGRSRLKELPPLKGPLHRLPRYDSAYPPTPSKSMSSLMHRQLLARFTPASVLINRQHEVLCFHGPTADYLEIPAGEPTRDLIAMARPGLSARLRTAVNRALENDGPVVDDEARVKRHGRYFPCTITVSHIQEPDLGQELLVTFAEQPSASARATREQDSEHDGIIHQLEYELKVTREDLQRHIEALEGANEDLKAANEETMSINEEMQSTNEELETAGEELQSMNEELTTVNNQLQSKVEELEARNDDISNLLTCSDVGTLFLDQHLRIKLFTPAVQRLLNLLERDVGRPLADFSLKFSDPQLLDDCRRVLDQLTAIETEVVSDAGRTYLRRIVPYRSQDNRVDGVVITFIDISDRKRADARERRLAQVLRDSNDAIIVQDLEGRIQGWNRGAEHLYGYTEAQALTLPITEIVPPTRRTEAAGLLQQIQAGTPVTAFETQRQHRDGQVLDVWLTVTPLTDESGAVTGVATTERDITQRKQTEQALQSLNLKLEQRVAARTAEIEAARERLRSIYRSAPVHLCSLDKELHLENVNQRFQEAFVADERPALGRPLDEAAPALARQLAPTLRQALAQARPIVDFEIQLPTNDGSCRTFLCTCDPGDRGTGRIGVALQDITSHKLLQDQLLSIAEETQQSVGKTLHDDVCQELTGLTLTSDALRLQLLKEQSESAALAATLTEAMERTRNKVRTLSHGLIPLAVDAQGLYDALAGLLAQTDEVYDIDCRFQASEELTVPDDAVATQLFHIAQEALSNALKHSRAKTITVTLEEEADGLTLLIEDDGIGLDGPRAGSQGLGLRIMKLRAERIGATLEIGSGRQGGTRIRCSLPHRAT